VLTPRPEKKRFGPLIVVVICLTILGSAIVNVYQIVNSTRPPSLYIKDFNVEYVMARAALNGESPYKPLPELARYADGYTAHYLQHPSPHPPAVIFVGIPFTRFALGRAVLLWLLLELLCVAVASALMLKAIAGRVSLVGVSVLVLVWLAWHPFEREMFWGQLMIVTLTLVCGAWVALRAQREMLGGVLLGVALALKLFGWPIVLFLLLTRRWRAFFSAVIAFALLHLAAALVIGFGDIVAYYRVVGPSVSKLYRGFAGNFSVWTIGTRVFGVSWTDWYNPLVHVPSIAPVVSVVAVVCVLILTIRGALHTRSFDSAFCALTCVSTVLNPIAWSHYLVLTAPALCLVAWRIKPGGFTRRTIIVAGALVVLGLLVEIVLPAIMWLSPRVPGASPVPFLVSTISFLPLVFVLLLTRVTLDDSMPVES
jgi:hypothetical protein